MYNASKELDKKILKQIKERGKNEEKKSIKDIKQIKIEIIKIQKLMNICIF